MDKNVFFLKKVLKNTKKAVILRKKNNIIKIKSALETFIKDSDSLVFCCDADGVIYIFKENDCLKKNRALRCDRRMISVTNAAKYLIKLFYESSQRYSASCVKIEKLLAIVALTEMRDNNKVFFEDISSYKCGMGFPDVARYFISDVFEGEEKPKGTIIQNVSFNKNSDIPLSYRIDDNEIDETLADLIKLVYINFGAWSSKDLGCELEDLKEYFLEVDENAELGKIVNMERVYRFFFNDSLTGLENNYIVKFISEYINKKE